jgi:Na+/H+ antiporter NhaA
MAPFFVVGLEIKRELAVGELCRARTAALPAGTTSEGIREEGGA